ncbi:hypothetical protein FQA39_LY00989 [Lamprigera yunnana]|nr:hypothetical protein FQA39_LY00989 [Lamprigera yunnana]
MTTSKILGPFINNLLRSAIYEILSKVLFENSQYTWWGFIFKLKILSGITNLCTSFLEKRINLDDNRKSVDDIKMRDNYPLTFFVNGKKVVEERPDPEWTLLHYLRNKFNACLAPVCSMHGYAVTTVEGIGSTTTKLHPVQERIAKSHGSQCGFCTPGIVMSMYTLLRNSPKPAMRDLETTFQGNLCRCTGYRPIVEGFKTFTEEWELIQNQKLINNNDTKCGMGDQCCKLQNGVANGYSGCEDALFERSEFIPYDSSQEPIFPPELKLYDTLDKQYLIFKGKHVFWFRPTTLNELLDLKAQYPDAKIVVGNTEVGVETKFKNCNYPYRICPVVIDEMIRTTVGACGVTIGASVTLQNMSSFLKKQIDSQPKYKTKIFRSIIDMMQWFAGCQIRNVAAVGGNIMTGSPISDLNQIFIAAKIELELQSKSNGSRRIVMDENFFTSYRTNVVRKDEVLVAIRIPFTTEYQYFYSYKQARRRDDDTAIVNSAINVTFLPMTTIIEKIKVAFGGMAPTTVVPIKTCKDLQNLQWNEDTLNKAYELLIEDLPLSPDAPGGMTQYRRSLTLCFFFRAYLAISKELQMYASELTIDDKDLSAIDGFFDKVSDGTYSYEIISRNEEVQHIGKPLPHISAFKHATGEAVYCDDVPQSKDELYMALVLSQRAHAKFVLDATEALNTEGVKLFVSAKDIPPEKNYLDGPEAEIYFADETVTAQGQILGAIIADDLLAAQRAARKVKVTYEDLYPVIVSVEDAVKYDSYFGEPVVLEDGNVDEVFATAPHMIEGEFRSGAQEHFYLETLSVVAVPKKEDGEMDIICSTQNPKFISKAVASILNVSQNKIITRVKRLGGGFGGKEWQTAFVAVPAAIAASKLNRPVRCMLDRDEDMILTGKRHPLYTKYKCAFDDTGKILGWEMWYYINAGYANHMSIEVLTQVVLKSDNVYKVPNVRCIGYNCKTNILSNQAFRAFGAPQSVVVTENIVRQVAEYLHKDYLEIARLNFYKNGDSTFYHQKLENLTIERCWLQCKKSSRILQRRENVELYNSKNRWKKRGIAMVPLKYGVGLPILHLNQATALIHIYTDGSVLLSHGGIEMGQGLHTKMIQVAAQILQISPNKIHINETSTDKIPNSTATVASVSSDFYGVAVKLACEELNKRLKPYKTAYPCEKWENWVLKAYMDRVNLSATGFFRRERSDDDDPIKGIPYNYYSIGAACSEVEIDCLTGDHQVIRTDIVMDVGNSLNPAIDIGQIEGAFIQGYGFYMMEELMYSPNGLLLTKGPGSYKLPGFGNVPLEFNVSLLKDAPNANAIYSSKAIGEPPLCLASSILFAAREAIKAARAEYGLKNRDFKVDSPLTSAKIRMLCEDHITSKGSDVHMLVCGENAGREMVRVYYTGNCDNPFCTEKYLISFIVNACLAPVCAMHGLAVTTVEGIGSIKTKLHPVQERIAKAHGSQCGFCTPGIVMSMYTLLRNSPKPSINDLEVTFQGNLCRCTGYRAIIEGYKTFAEDWEIMQNGTNENGTCAMGEKCCKLTNGDKEYEDPEENVLFNWNEFTPYDPTQEPIFPAELKLYDLLDNQNLMFKDDQVVWYRPTDLTELLNLKRKHPDSKIIVGNTEVGVEVKFKHFSYPVLIQPVMVPEMTEIRVLENGLRIGASVTLQDMENALKAQIRVLPPYKTRVFVAIVEMLNWFAGKQIRNVAAIGGNIMTGSPISDLNPLFMASAVKLQLQSKDRGTRHVTMDRTFFTGYRRTTVENDEVLVAVIVPHTSKYQYFFAYKQARRREDDIAIVNAAVNVTFETDNALIKQIDFAFGGMAPTTVMAPITSNSLVGKRWNKETLEFAVKHLLEDLPLSPSAPGGMTQYRRSLTISFFFKAFMAISKELQSYVLDIRIDAREESAIEGFQSKVPKSSQYFQISGSHKENAIVGQPLQHKSAFKQATGEAVYLDDIPTFSNELYMSLVFSSRTHAKIININADEALNLKGVHAFFSAEDLSAYCNSVGPQMHDDEVFASKTVKCNGQVLGAIIAVDQATAQRAARLVKVSYEEIEPVIITIEDAIKHKSFILPKPKKIERGNVDKAFAEAPHVIEGESRNGAQEHFYFETQCVLVVPKEDDEMEVFCSTQHPTETTKLISHMLEIPQSKIVTRVKRMGGGFGGKESKSFMVALPAALAANRLNRPVRCMLDRDEDMLITGMRHPFKIQYKVAFDDDGKIIAAELFMYCNSGYSADLTIAILERAMFLFENAYKIPNTRVIGYACKTNLPSNTAFRGFGGPQGMFASEHFIRDIAEYLQKDVVDVARLNFYQEGDVTHYNQKLLYCNILRCWEECLESSSFYRRKNEVEKFNRNHRWKKRGISVVPTKFGISFTVTFLNQAGALVHVYTDGSVLLTHGGTEMGQGLHTKMIQIASEVLDIPHHRIHISETSTDKVPNTSATAASAGSDLNGMAVMNACKVIKERLQPYKEANPKGKWNDWVQAAYLDRVSLSSAGYYKTPDLGYSFETNSGNAFNYYTYGAACSEVEIDCLTGDHQVLRTDIVMDLGDSLNPAIDVGQVEGAFMQGYGLFVLEEVVLSPTGVLYTRGPGAYKIPGFADIPHEFNVSLLKGAPNPRAVYSSKAVGEPPLFLASSIYFAIREAIKMARTDAGLPITDFEFFAPATAAKIRMACEDYLTDKLDKPKPGSYTPWNIIP